MNPSTLTSANQPDGHFAQQVILLLQLLHLTFAHSLVIGFEEVLFHLMPWPYILSPERNANPLKR
jgi:hypothetical protein